MTERDAKRAALAPLGMNYTSFKQGEMDSWLDRLALYSPEEITAVVDFFLSRDPRQTEAARRERPKLADLIRYLPSRGSQAGECKGWYCLNTFVFAGDIAPLSDKERKYMIAALRKCPRIATYEEQRNAFMAAAGITMDELAPQQELAV